MDAIEGGIWQRPIALEPHEVSDLLARRWQVDCRIIELTQQSASDPAVFSGPGWIRQDGNGQIKYKMLCQQPPTAFAKLRPTSAEAGKVIPADQHYRFHAMDEHGRTWRAEEVRPGQMKRQLASGVLLGDLPQITSNRENHLGRACVSVVYPGAGYIPRTTGTDTYRIYKTKTVLKLSQSNTAEAIAGDHRFTFEVDRNGDLFAVINSDGAPAPNIQTRLTEALRFLLAMELGPLIVARFQDGDESVDVFGIQPLDPPWQRRFPPIHYTQILKHTDAFWKMFVQYLRFASENDDFIEPMVGRIDSILEASAASFEALALGVSVAVEGIVRDYLPAIEMDASLDEHVKSAVALLRGSDLPRDFLQRAITKLEQLRQPPTSRQLRVLVARGTIDQNLVKAWETLRPLTAHANTLRNKSMQDKIDLIAAVSTLLNRLVLEVIGYSGPFTDYGSHGWPVRQHHCSSS